MDLGIVMGHLWTEGQAAQLTGLHWRILRGALRPGQARRWGFCSPRGTGMLCATAEEGFTPEGHTWEPITPVAPFCWHI